jgi:hypothetical protein
MMTINTENYEATHGRKPKPSQYGAWIFSLCRDHASTSFTATGTYRDALRDAKAEAKQISGINLIVVQD